eukprot:CFRG5945T1
MTSVGEKKRNSVADILHFKKKATSESTISDPKKMKRKSLARRITGVFKRGGETKPANYSSDDISEGAERQMQKACLESSLNFKILLLGAGECGKSTILKQIRVIHKIDFNADELRSFGVNLRRNTVQSMQVLIEACSTISPPIDLTTDSELMSASNLVRNFDFADDDSTIPTEIYNAVHTCWKNTLIRDAWLRRDEYWCLDSIEYYFDNMVRFCDPEFLPDEQDCVMARIITTGIISTELSNPPLHFEVIDVGGQRNERRKWIHCFDNVSCVFYVVNLAGYGSVIYEDSSVNRMQEALNVFTQTVNSRVFADSKIALILNKKDVFEEMLRKRPLTDCFPEYSGPNEDVNSAIEFVITQFRNRLKSNPDRMMSFNIAARYKKDVKLVWDDVTANLKNSNLKSIESTVKELSKLEVGPNITKPQQHPQHGLVADGQE